MVLNVIVILSVGCAQGTSVEDGDEDEDDHEDEDGGSDVDVDVDVDVDGDGDGDAGDSDVDGDGTTPIAGSIVETPMGVEIYLPTSYVDGRTPSPILWLWNESFDDWRALADEDEIVLVDVTYWVGDEALADALNESESFLLADYDVDRSRYYWAGWSGGGNAVVIDGSINQEFLAGVMVFPGTGGDYAAANLEGWDGHKMRFFYACGTADEIYPADGVEAEAAAWTEWGYETRFERVDGASHYIDEATYGIRRTAWEWIRSYTLEN